MLRETLNAIRDLPRLHEITSVFIRHGLGDFVRRMGVAGVLERAGQVLHFGDPGEAVKLAPAERMRLALEELGPTFIKLGQVLATRVDLLPPDWITELEKLHSDVPPVAFEELLPEIEAALGQPVTQLFAHLDPQPLGAASIAQVHRARLKDGASVVVKVQRPGVRAKTEADLRLLGHLASLIESEVPEARRYQPIEIAAQFARSMERELDFTIEARHMERFRVNFEHDPFIVIPRVYSEYTRTTVLVQEAIDGVRGNDLAGIDAAGYDKRLLASRGAEAFLDMILLHGFFHADPHPGNVFYLPGHRIAIIDHGMVGRFSPTRRRQVIDVLAGLAKLEEEPMLDVLLDWAGDAYVDETRLAHDINELVFDYEHVPLKDIRIGQLIRQFTAIVREHSIVLPADLTLMFKALMTLEGLGRQYDPEFRIVDHLTPLLREALGERYRPAELLRRGKTSVNDFVNVIGSVPRDLARLLREARRGKTRIDLDMKRLDTFGKQLDRTLDRTTVGVMTASLVIGSSIVLTVPQGPEILGVSVLRLFGTVGFIVAFINSIWIIYGIWRAGKE